MTETQVGVAQLVLKSSSLQEEQWDCSPDPLGGSVSG